MSLQHSARYGSDPRARNSTGLIVGWRQFIRSHRTPPRYFLQYPRGILRALFQNLGEAPRSNAIRLAPVSQQRPSFHRDDRDFVRPMLGKFAAAIDQLIECGAIIGT